jgi:hypothetical protein
VSECHNTIKTDIREMGWDGRDCIHVTQDEEQCRARVCKGNVIPIQAMEALRVARG